VQPAHQAGARQTHKRGPEAHDFQAVCALERA
jgi:hypothetical protein